MVLLTRAKNSKELFFMSLSKVLTLVTCLSALAAFNQNQRTLLMPQTRQSLLHLVLRSASFWSGF